MSNITEFEQVMICYYGKPAGEVYLNDIPIHEAGEEQVITLLPGGRTHISVSAAVVKSYEKGVLNYFATPKSYWGENTPLQVYGMTRVQ